MQDPRERPTNPCPPGAAAGSQVKTAFHLHISRLRLMLCKKKGRPATLAGHTRCQVSGKNSAIALMAISSPWCLSLFIYSGVVP